MKFINSLILVILVVIGMSCDILNLNPSDQFSEKNVWNDPDLIEAYINDIYLSMGHGQHEILLASLSDETHFTHGYGVPVIVESKESPGDLGAFGRDDLNYFVWGNVYSGIKQVNDFFEHIKGTDIEDQEALDELKGQAYFLRAYLYHNLLRMYGGVPIITDVATLDEQDSDELLVQRNSFGETANFIVNQADSAAQFLPLEQTGNDLGRASKGAALALKSRVLLYAASDLYHQNPSGNDFTGYTGSQDRQQMWRDAKNAAQEVMDLGVYSLFRPNPAGPEEASQNYYELFTTDHNSESIMERKFLDTRDDGYNPGLMNLPNGYHNYGGNTPIQALIDDYQMLDGSDFSWDDPDKAKAPYENRDPRLNGTILHDGSPWQERPKDIKKYDKNNKIQTISKIKLPNGNVVPGVDTRNSPNEDWNGTYTGYYLKKYLRDDVNHGTSTKQQGIWYYFRYTEVLLNYTEASIELKEYADARQALNKIRTRAGMPTYSSSVTGEELMEEYRNERRVEMAIEGQRFFDLRRWMIAQDVMNENVKRIVITAEATDRADRNTYQNYTYEVEEIGPGSRSWEDKMYFQPIPKDEMNRNKNLEQNPGY
ncbi:MAG TPA: RagB/SusD family nutrient uptake outer membrane protein [Fodinibius sp.]|nr:RagB/SusD family nutrient uptake outer membrane protein [Fodinibius sp.]